MSYRTRKSSVLEDVLIGISLVVNLVFYHLSGVFPRKKNLLIFGAWGGNKYSDNPRFLFEKLCSDKAYPDLELVWVGKRHMENHEAFKHPRVTFVSTTH